MGGASKAIKGRMFGYIAAGLGLVAALAWNDAIKQVIDYFIPNAGNGIVAKLGYAVIVTLIVGLMLYYVEKFTREEER